MTALQILSSLSNAGIEQIIASKMLQMIKQAESTLNDPV
jgi:hypothetical protein